MKQLFEDLRQALLAIPASGEKGFEGLLGLVLGDVTGVVFRLAASGSQWGLDGKSSYDFNRICFESKRYHESPPRESVISKIAEIGLRRPDVDLWILCATCSVSVQLADDVRQHGDKIGLSTLVLDWSGEFPSLAAIMAMSGKTENFLEAVIEDKAILEKAKTTLRAIRNADEYASQEAQLRRQLHDCYIGIPAALHANEVWLSSIFSSRQKARNLFGQAVSPRDPAGPPVLTRSTLVDDVHSYLKSGCASDQVLFLTGHEGVGKTWMVAQAWTALDAKPLMVLISAEELASSAYDIVAKDLIISAILKQTGQTKDVVWVQRWTRRLENWREAKSVAPNLLVVIDGINQRPNVKWSKLLGAIFEEASEIGASIVVTSRKHYYDTHKYQFAFSFTELFVPEWTDTERDEILKNARVDVDERKSSIAKILNNPRLLSVAIELLANRRIQTLHELSMARLMFEYIVLDSLDGSASINLVDASKCLQTHASEIVDRLSRRELDDLCVFEGGLEYVAAGRFFAAIPDDPSLYVLRDEGLELALGLAVNARLKKALRNNYDPEEVLSTLIEPISALDKTAEVLHAALTIACVDDASSPRLISTLVKGFLLLQNPDEDLFRSFSALGRSNAKSFMWAAQDLCLAEKYYPNLDWLYLALSRARSDMKAWEVIRGELKNWLKQYSLSPDRGVFSHSKQNGAAKISEERAEREKRIRTKLSELSELERCWLNEMKETEGNLNDLIAFGFQLLAGKPLAEFAPAISRWCFGEALNSEIRSPYDDLNYLVRLNRVDWEDVRSGLLQEANLLRSNSSRTGRWALVTILRCTGSADDALEAEKLVRKLNDGQDRSYRFRLVERYCESDPCDPGSIKPANVVETAVEYSEMDMSKVRLTLGQTSEDLFFEGARAGVVRFEPSSCIAKHIELAKDVRSRTGLPLRQGLLELTSHSPIIGSQLARQLARGPTEPGHELPKGAEIEGEQRLLAQCRQAIVFPFLSGEEQLEALLDLPKSVGLPLELLESVKTLAPDIFEEKLSKAIEDKDERAQFFTLAIGRQARVKPTRTGVQHLRASLTSASAKVRAQAFGMIADREDVELLEVVAQGGWDASSGQLQEANEFWYVSLALIAAGANGLLDPIEMVQRLAPQLYGEAAYRLNGAAAEVARRIDASICAALDLSVEADGPDLIIDYEDPARSGPPLVSFAEKPTKSNDIGDMLKSINDGFEEFYERQHRNVAFFRKFKAALTRERAQILLDPIRLKQFQALLRAWPQAADRWYELFLSVPTGKLPHIYNFVLFLAYALSEAEPQKAAKLFSKVERIRPAIWLMHTTADVPLGSMALWRAADHPYIVDLRTKQLDGAESDYEIFIEVLAAELCGKGSQLVEYVEGCLHAGSPERVARALTVAGFSEPSDFQLTVLRRYEDSRGFLRTAYESARRNYDKNIWAKIWFDEMIMAASNEEFWRAGVLFKKIVDGRFVLWKDRVSEGSVFDRFWLSMKGDLRRRFNKQKSSREKTLFGGRAPDPIYLERVSP